MSFPDVLKRGDDFLSEKPRSAVWWNYLSHATCFSMIMGSKAFLNLLYKPQVHHIEKLDGALARARAENRSLLTVMNHMSVVDDPCVFAMLPMRFHTDIDTVRWGFGAHNICFSTPTLSWFFNLGKVLGTKRFGEGPFQGSIDAAIRILSPDDTLDLEYNQWDRPQSTLPKMADAAKANAPPVEATATLMAKSPFVRTKTSWFHVFPEGFVLQLEKPDNNSMRYFKWGISRLVLESTRAPVVVPMFAYGFEKIVPEDLAGGGIQRFVPRNLGAEIHLCVGDPVADDKINAYREEWQQLCRESGATTDLTEDLKTGPAAQELRSRLAADLRSHVQAVRASLGVFTEEKEKFKDPAFWKQYTLSEGSSDPEVRFIGQNWAIKRLQKHLDEFEE